MTASQSIFHDSGDFYILYMRIGETVLEVPWHQRTYEFSSWSVETVKSLSMESGRLYYDAWSRWFHDDHRYRPSQIPRLLWNLHVSAPAFDLQDQL